MLESVRAADCNGDLADPHARRIAKATPREIARRNLEQCEIGVRIIADDRCRGGATVRQRHFDGSGTAGHMAVGDQIAVGRNDESRTGTFTSPSRWLCTLDADVSDGG